MPTQAQFDTALQTQRDINIRVKVLDENFFELDEISGIIVSSDISLDADADVRRTANITMQIRTPFVEVASQLIDVYWSEGETFWFDKYIQIEVAIKDIYGDEYEWVNQGIYMINAPNITYEATGNQLTFQAVDLMAKMTGMRNGYLEGMAYEIPSGTTITDVIEDLLKESGFNNYILLEPPTAQTPYDVKVDIGSTVFDLLKELKDINANWEMFFDENGTFIFQQIPSGKIVIDPSTGEEGEPLPLVSDEVWKELHSSYQLSNDFEKVKNYIHVLGKTHEPSYWGNTTPENNSITITDNSLKVDSVEGEYNWIIGTNIYTDGTLVNNVEQGAIDTLGQNNNQTNSLVGAVRLVNAIPIEHNTQYRINYPNRTSKDCYVIAYYYDSTKNFVDYTSTALGNTKNDLSISFTTPDNASITYVRFVFSGYGLTGDSDLPIAVGWILQQNLIFTNVNQNSPLDTTLGQTGKLLTSIDQVTLITSTLTLTDIPIIGLDDKPNSIKYVNEAYIFDLRRDAEGNYQLVYYGYIQPQARAWENNPESPFYVGDVIGGYMTSMGSEANIITNALQVYGNIDATQFIPNTISVDLTNILSLAEITDSPNGTQWKIQINLDDSINVPISETSIQYGTVSETRDIKDSQGQYSSFDFNDQAYLLTITHVSGQTIAYAWDYLPITAEHFNTPTDEFSELKFNKAVRYVCTGDEYDNIFTNDLARDRANYEVYLQARLHDTITIESVPIYWLEVNQIIEYIPENEAVNEREANNYWLVKTINTTLSTSGKQNITAIRYYPLYPSV